VVQLHFKGLYLKLCNRFISCSFIVCLRLVCSSSFESVSNVVSETTGLVAGLYICLLGFVFYIAVTKKEC
jgi:hypothetical protein